MKWILDDIRNALNALKHGSTWIVIGMISAFALLAYSIFHFAVQTDAVVRHLKYSMASCREMTNGPIIFLFCGMIFFLFAAVVALGEVQRYFHFRTRKSRQQMQQSLKHGLGWAGFALSIAIGGLIFFNMNCR